MKNEIIINKKENVKYIIVVKYYYAFNKLMLITKLIKIKKYSYYSI